jgi:hypothetical protein
MADEYIQRITSFLGSHGISSFNFEHLAKHRAVVIPYQGRLNRVVFPTTGGDWRGPANTVSTIRHVLGLFEAKTSTERRIRKPHKAKTASSRDRQVARASFVESSTPTPDKFFGPLMVLKARMDAAVSLAAEAVPAPRNVTTSRTNRTRVALRTPWLGKHTRYAII